MMKSITLFSSLFLVLTTSNAFGADTVTFCESFDPPANATLPVVWDYTSPRLFPLDSRVSFVVTPSKIEAKLYNILGDSRLFLRTKEASFDFNTNNFPYPRHVHRVEFDLTPMSYDDAIVVVSHTDGTQDVVIAPAYIKSSFSFADVVRIELLEGNFENIVDDMCVTVTD